MNESQEQTASREDKIHIELEAARINMEHVWVECGHNYDSEEYQTAQARYDAAVRAHNDYYRSMR